MRHDDLFLPILKPSQLKIINNNIWNPLFSNIMVENNNYINGQSKDISADESTGPFIRYYRCKICDKTHKVELNKNICDGRAKYPFPYVILHDSVHNGEVQELLTILHIDKNCAIRAAEVQHFEGHLFSKEQVVAITTPLMEEIKMLRDALSQKDREIELLKAK